MHIALVQQGVWHMSKESMPLAAGYLAAAVGADDYLSGSTVRIHNFPGYRTPLEMAADLLGGPPLDVVAFSVLGWNFRQFGAVAEAVRRFRPGARIVFGGNHVAHQAERVFRLHDAVDVVVNGEGESTFVQLIRAFRDDLDLSAVPGISFRHDGTLITTPTAARLDDLDVIPSPILTGTIPLLATLGEFRYDVALMETNRGCPYKCAFCYWGGAVGQQRFLFWARLLAENLVLRNVWPVATAVLGWEQSATILSIADHIESSTGTGAELIRSAAAAAVADPDSLAPALEFCFSESAFDDLIIAWCDDVLLQSCPRAWQQAARDVVQFDLDTRPLPDPARRGLSEAVLEEVRGAKYWRRSRSYETDVPALVQQCRAGSLQDDVPPKPSERTFLLLFRDGFAALARSTNHEETAHYVAHVELAR